MEKHISGLLVVIAAVFLLVGGLVGYNVGEAQVETNTITEYVDRNVSVTEYVDVPAPSQLNLAVAEFLKAVEDEEDEAGYNVDVLGTYDFDEMEVSRIYADHNVSYEDEKTTIDFKIRLRFDEDDAESTKRTYNVTVVFDQEEDNTVDYDLV